jgi:superfamily I DNA/RNA helicase
LITKVQLLKSAGKRNQYDKAMKLITELQMNIDTTQAFRDDNRIPNCRKYELPDGYRIVFQKVTDVNALIGLTVGKHDDVDNFLDAHKGYIFNTNGAKIKILNPLISNDFFEEVKVTTIPKKMVEIENLLNELSDTEYSNLGLSKENILSIRNFSNHDDPEFLQFLDILDSSVADTLLCYVTSTPSDRVEWKEIFKSNIKLKTEIRKEEYDSVIKSSNEFVNIRDIPEVCKAFNELSFDDWLIFLHPDQKRFAYNNWNGPVKISGVAGSGKTIVALHHAKYQISKATNNKRILLITYNKTLSEFLSERIKQLIEPNDLDRIEIMTIDKWCRHIVDNAPNAKKRISDNEIVDSIWNEVINKYIDILKAPLSSLDNEQDIFNYIKDEIYYIYGKYLHEETGNYLNDERNGRGYPLTKENRKIVLDCYNEFVLKANERNQFIPMEINRIALNSMIGWNYATSIYSSIIIDEYQDLTEIHMRIIKIAADKKSLMLVGDETQKILARGYSFKSVGINVIGRSFYLERNYRNSVEITRAANKLQENFAIGKFNEDYTSLPAKSINASTLTPTVLIFKNENKEYETVKNEILALKNNFHIELKHICITSRQKHTRESILKFLNNNHIPAVASNDGNANSVRISTLHNVKGLEYRAIFIMDFYECSIPFYRIGTTIDPDLLEKEAALLYVNMTRAKEFLYFTFTSINNRVLSRFFEPISDYVERIEM